MAQFFIDRPIFAWVIALFISVIGGAAITQLPISQYPTVAPPAIVITATYPGASAKTLEESVVSLIEQEMNGAQGMIYVESVSQATGQATITVTFAAGTNPDLAQVDVQNRLSRATPRLPAAVTQQGVRVDKSRANFLLFTILYSDGGQYNPVTLGDYASRTVLPEIQRIPGVGQAQLFGTERAMRVWLDPNKLVGYNLTTDQVNAAVRAQNAVVSGGAVGDLPNLSTQEITATVLVAGQLTSPEAFGNIVLRANTDGSTVRLRDVARIELGAQQYQTSARFNGQPSTGIGVQLSPTGNALATAKAVHAKMAELSKFFPAGVKYEIPYDTSTFVALSIEKVVHTLLEAVVLVFLVMLLFLQNLRYTLIPTIVVPVALLGTFAVLAALGYSINVLTMFAMVLAIGILVDDAILVVENVERLMAEEGLAPKEAARKGMRQISAAIVGVTVVLISVFIPLAFFGGSVGNIYRQFSVTMVASLAFSAFLALSLTPALCATLLKPIAKGSHIEKKGFFGWFNRTFKRVNRGYEGTVSKLIRRSGRMMLIYLVIVGVVGFLFMRMPTSFLPNEDQGYLITNIQLPPGATVNRTEAVVKQIEQFYLKQPEVAKMVAVLGFSFSGQGQNAGLAFTVLKDWDERTGAGQSAQGFAQRAFGTFMRIRDAFIYPLSPPPIPELGTGTGFVFRLQDRAAQGDAKLLAAREQLLGLARQSKLLTAVRFDGLDDAPQLRLNIDRDKANALGIDFASIGTALSTAMGSSYINDFPNAGRMQRVVVQADSPRRMDPEDLLRINVMSSSGKMVPISAFSTTEWTKGPVQSVRYNGYPAARIAGEPAPGVSSGAAMAEMERLAAQLPAGFGFEWTGQSREEKLASGSQVFVLLGLSLLAVFLALAALYESWSIPLAVMLVVPLGVLGSLVGADLRGLPNDVYFKVGLIAIIGLSAKNAILIIEFAKDLHREGKGLLEATLEACHLRFRPIIMTSMAFILGVLPLMLATGASSASQNAIGTGVVGGMISAMILAVIFVPVFFVFVSRIFKPKQKPEGERTGGGGAISSPAAPETSHD
ncbi:MAG: efflux RND transporter permease subunit [Burkholderiaceae bacterium]